MTVCYQVKVVKCLESDKAGKVSKSSLNMIDQLIAIKPDQIVNSDHSLDEIQNGDKISAKIKPPHGRSEVIFECVVILSPSEKRTIPNSASTISIVEIEKKKLKSEDR